MRLILLTSITMLAFAANSLLTRLAVDSGAASAGGFAILRVAAGAAMLLALASLQGRGLRWTGAARFGGALSLTLYMLGFSIAYLTLDAGLGALILFGVVQVGMFTLSALQGRKPGRRDLAGAVIAFGGLAWVVWPSGAAQVEASGAVAMGLAGLGWAAYTLLGRSERDPLAGTAANFALALPVTALAILALDAPLDMTARGAALAVLSGAVTSGLGYALWYALQPQLGAIRAAVVQLSVPVIALGLGAWWLGESLTPRLLLGGALVLGGIALTLPIGRKR